MSSQTTSVAIVGGGIGGLAAGLALLRAGIDVTIYEQAAELQEVGAGVQISPNGTRLLRAWGLEDAMRSLGTGTAGKEVRVWNTASAKRFMELGAEADRRYGAPYLTFHRADLHGMLLAAVRREKANAVQLGRKLTRLLDDGPSVHLEMADGSTVQADAAIGADGVHSRARQLLFGADKPRFTGCMAWRGVIDTAHLPASINRSGGVSWLGPTAHVLTYPIRQGRMLNFIGMVDRDDWTVDSWSASGTTEECLRDFEGWHPDVVAMARAIAIQYKWALIVREPLPQWTVGRVSLLGDACHSTLPFLAQGANMALEDAMVLSRCIAHWRGDLPQALTRYQSMRRERTTRIVRESAAQITRVHTPALAQEHSAHEHIEREWQAASVNDRYDWVYSYDAMQQPLA